MKFEYWNSVKTSTWFKLLVAAGVSYVLYLLAGFMLPILLAIGLAFGHYPILSGLFDFSLYCRRLYYSATFWADE